MTEDNNLLQLQDDELKALVQSHKAEIEQKTSELNELQATLLSQQEQLGKKQAALIHLQSQCCHDNVIELMTDVRQMKDNIKETQYHQDHVDIQLTTILQGEIPSELLSEVAALREKVKEKELLLQQLNNQLSKVQQVKPFMDSNQVKIYWYKQLYTFVDKFFHGNM